ncbi:hypothetical protein Tco_0593510 [Tanacetum coccineum]
MLDRHRKELHEQFSQILSAIEESGTPKPEAPTFAITTTSRVSTQDPPFSTVPLSRLEHYQDWTTNITIIKTGPLTSYQH